ncbi:MAG: hypothetical protein K2M46_05755 [Lachnospiraceae bacterium]|nr:hypothetical protein [Lachnospiraceae bacterium]
MAVARKYKRKLIYNEMIYMWCVTPGEDAAFHRLVLHIVSSDKAIILDCPLDNSLSFVVSQGRMFQGKKQQGGWQRYLFPGSIQSPITPAIVAELIAWATCGEGAISVAFDGDEIWL